MVKAQEYINNLINNGVRDSLNIERDRIEITKYIDGKQVKVQEFLEGKLDLRGLTNPEIWIDGQQISTIVLGNNPNLKKIKFTNSQTLGRIIIEGTLPNLKEINCSGNNLLRGLDFSGAPKLEVLDISNSNFEDKVEGKKLEGDGQNLTVLRASKNKLGRNTLNRININPKKLEELDIRNNKFGVGDLEELAKHTKLKILKIGNDNDNKVKYLERFNKFGHPEEGNSLYCLRNLKNLERLHIGNTYINMGLEWLPLSLKEIEFESGPGSDKIPFKSDELKKQLNDSQIDFTNCYDLEGWRQEFPLYQSFAEEQRKNAELEKEKEKQGQKAKSESKMLADAVLKSWDENYQLEKKLQSVQKENTANSQLIDKGKKYLKNLEKENGELVEKYNGLVDLAKEGMKRITEKDNIILQQQYETERLDQILENEKEVLKSSQKLANQLGIKLDKKQKNYSRPLSWFISPIFVAYSSLFWIIDSDFNPILSLILPLFRIKGGI